MPVVYRCSNCGRILYFFNSSTNTGEGLPTPSEVIQKLGGKCPYCGHKLRKPTLSDITIRLLEER